jgi:hypothetical protein
MNLPNTKRRWNYSEAALGPASAADLVPLHFSCSNYTWQYLITKLLVACLAYSSAMKMEAVRSSKMLVNFYRTTQRHITDSSWLRLTSNPTELSFRAVLAFSFLDFISSTVPVHPSKLCYRLMCHHCHLWIFSRVEEIEAPIYNQKHNSTHVEKPIVAQTAKTFPAFCRVLHSPYIIHRYPVHTLTPVSSKPTLLLSSQLTHSKSSLPYKFSD